MNQGFFYVFMSGSIMTTSWVAGVFFLRFWTKSKDRLFLLFGVAFWVLALERVMLLLRQAQSDDDPSLIYLLRLVAFGLIMGAIVDKNRKER